MSPDTLDAEQAKPLQIMWAAFLVSTIIYAAIGWVLGRGGERTQLNREILGWVQVFFGMSAGLIVLTVFLLRQLLAAVTRHNYQTYCLVRWAMLEMIAMFGLVQFVLGGPFEVLLIFLALTLLSLGAARPGLSDHAGWQDQFR